MSGVYNKNGVYFERVCANCQYLDHENDIDYCSVGHGDKTSGKEYMSCGSFFLKIKKQKRID
jgi:hypothetical protein